MALFPFFAQLQDKPVLVVGGGAIAERKIRLLRKSAARITVRAPQFNDAIRALAHHADITLSDGVFEPHLLDGVRLVVAATNDQAVNAEIARQAEVRNLFINVVDDPVLSSIQTPAIIDRDPLMIGISSAGSAPMIARAVRELIETVLDDGMGRLTLLVQEYRHEIQNVWPDIAERRAFYTWLLRSSVLGMVRDENWAKAHKAMRQALDYGTRQTLSGQVTILPVYGSDPGLLTLHALRVLNQADLIIYPDTVDEALLEPARRDAALFTWPTNTPPNNTINDLIDSHIVQPALSGESVVVFHTDACPPIEAMARRCQVHDIDPTILPAVNPVDVQMPYRMNLQTAGSPPVEQPSIGEV